MQTKKQIEKKKENKTITMNYAAARPQRPPLIQADSTSPKVTIYSCGAAVMFLSHVFLLTRQKGNKATGQIWVKQNETGCTDTDRVPFFHYFRECLLFGFS